MLSYFLLQLFGFLICFLFKQSTALTKPIPVPKRLFGVQVTVGSTDMRLPSP